VHPELLVNGPVAASHVNVTLVGVPVHDKEAVLRVVKRTPEQAVYRIHAKDDGVPVHVRVQDGASVVDSQDITQVIP
jgi:hypothetical protein